MNVEKPPNLPPEAVIFPATNYLIFIYHILIKVYLNIYKRFMKIFFSRQ